MSNATENKRIEYIDLLKGFAILWIVWWHTCHPAFINPYYHVPLFFFISGIFFKPYPLKEYLKKKTDIILIPFAFFYLISYLYRILLHLWDNRSIENFPWGNIFDVFKCMPNGDYLWVNVPIWFLLCLFNVCIFYYFIYKLPLWFKCTYIVIVLLLSSKITQISTPFFINDAIKWTAYYAFGDIAGKKILQHLSDTSKGIIYLIACCILYIVFKLIFRNYHLLFFDGFDIQLLTVIFIIGITSLFSFTQGKKALNFLRYYGNNSLIVLGTHAPLLIVYQRIICKYFGSVNYWGGLFVFIATSLTMIIVIPVLKKYFPKFIGVKPLLSTSNR